MQNTIHRRVHAACRLGLIVAVLAIAMPVFAGVKESSAAGQVDSTEAWAKILDPQIPLAMRQQNLAQLERTTKSDDQNDLYLLGSLYYMGQRASGGPVQQDLGQAAIYMGNAAIHGSLLGMAKMAEIDLALHKYQEAMIWAQVYGHYAMLPPEGERPNQGYTAELIQRIIDKLGRSGVTQAMPEVANFLASHDDAIRAGTNSDFEGRTSHPPIRKPKQYVAPGYRMPPQSGIADYLLAFTADGSVAHAWLLDSIPDREFGEALRKYVGEMSLPAIKAQAGQSLRYAWLPVLFDDHRYHVSPSR